MADERKQLPPQPPQQSVDRCSDTMMNMTLVDPTKWGWSCVGGVTDLLPPHHRARRKKTKLPRKVKGKEKVVKEQQRKNREAEGTTMNEATAASGEGCSSTAAETASSSKDALHLQVTDNTTDQNTAKVSAAQQQQQQQQQQAARTNGVVVESAKRRNSGVDPQQGFYTTSEKDNTIKIHPTKEGVLDMFSYHRGREGDEPRDRETGMLLNDLPSSTVLEPNRTAHITITFPLGPSESIKLLPDGVSRDDDDDDDENNNHNNNNNDKKKETLMYFKESVEWDLTDCTTKSVMSFVSEIAAEYGLTYGQTMELAASIDHQLLDFCRSVATSESPVTDLDPITGAPRVTRQPSQPLQLYGSPSARVSGGLPRPVPKHHKKQPMASAAKRQHANHNNNSSHFAGHIEFNDKSPVEQLYKDELLKRAKAASIAQISETCQRVGSLPGLLGKVDDHVCHICHLRKPNSAVFACGKGHCFCDDHCKSRLGFSIANPETTPVTLHYCPVCCLSCGCGRCVKRIDFAATELKRRSVINGVGLEETVLEEVLVYCSGSRPKKSKRDSSNGSAPVGRPRNEDRIKIKNRRVRKVPASDFPRELCNGRDLEPGTWQDYSTVFTPDGAFLQQPQQQQPPKETKATTSEGQPQREKETKPPDAPSETISTNANGGVEVGYEDGNVDYCAVCLKHGSLLCCDYCPRAFHNTCLQSVRAGEGQKWECHVCVAEKQGIPQDLVDGKKMALKDKTYHDLIIKSLVGFRNSPGFTTATLVLAMILQMVDHLIEYEFGYIFQEPVDCEANPEYKKIVKNPMDLGTIKERLMAGTYAAHYVPKSSWDDVVLAALKDVELVWHNCFTFNYEGSSIYRMAEVHARRSRSIRKRSFEGLLSLPVRQELERYVTNRTAERSGMAPGPPQPPPVARPVSKYKIAVPFSPGGKCRTVAVLDPSTGRIAKLYTTLRAATVAATFLRSLGHSSEWSPITDHSVKSAIRRGATDPSSTLFGYRWMFHEDLLAGTAVFKRITPPPILKDGVVVVKKDTPPGRIQVTDGEAKLEYPSMEEALSMSALPADVPLDEIRKTLCGLQANQVATIVGYQWQRRLDPKVEEEEATNKNHSSAESSSSAVVKMDKVTGRLLVTFNSPQAAHLDWVKCCQSSFTVGLNQPQPQQGLEFEVFHQQYLLGDKCLDGVQWLMKERDLKNNNNNNKMMVDAPLDDYHHHHRTTTEEPMALNNADGTIPQQAASMQTTAIVAEPIQQQQQPPTPDVRYVSSFGENGKKHRIDEDILGPEAKKPATATSRVVVN